MTPPNTSAANLELILSAITEVKTMLTDLDGRVRALEQTTIAQSVTASQKLEAAFRQIDNHTSQLTSLRTDMDCRVRERVEITDKLSDRLTNVEGVAAFVKWLGAALGVLVVILLWKVFTGEITIR